VSSSHDLDHIQNLFPQLVVCPGYEEYGQLIVEWQREHCNGLYTVIFKINSKIFNTMCNCVITVRNKG